MRILVRKDRTKGWVRLPEEMKICCVCGEKMGPSTHVKLDGKLMHRSCWNRAWGKFEWVIDGSSGENKKGGKG